MTAGESAAIRGIRRVAETATWGGEARRKKCDSGGAMTTACHRRCQRRDRPQERPGHLILPFERVSPPLFVGETAGLSLPPGVRRSRLGKRPSPDGGFLEHSVTSHATSRVRGVRSGPCIQRSKIAGARVPRSTPRSRSGVSRFWTRCQRSNAAFPAILPARPADISGVDPAAAEQGRPLHRRGPRGEH